MGLETGTYILDLNTSNPASSDSQTQGDDHLRLIKSVLRNTFPNANRALRFPSAESKSANFSVAATDENKTFYVTTAGGSVTATLPSTTGLPAGWSCEFVKTNTGTNPLFVAPASGSVQSGDVSVSKARRCIPGVPFRVVWTGASWFVERIPRVPVGTVLDSWLASTPVGYEPANGTALSSSDNYPEYNAAKGNLTVPDCRGRVVAGRETTATLLTTAIAGLDGATLGAAGGDQRAQDHTHGPGTLAGITNTTGAHTHTLTAAREMTRSNASGNNPQGNHADDENITTSSAGNHFHTVTITSGVTANPDGTKHGGNSANVQPTIILNKIIVVE